MLHNAVPLSAHKHAAMSKYSFGICAMEKKSSSKPMRELITRLERHGHFEVKVFSEKIILEDKPQDWPTCNVLLCFYSDGFPLEKAKLYADLNPDMKLINDVHAQETLLDRRQIYSMLQSAGVRIPNHVVCNRNDPGHPASSFTEHEDYIECDGRRINKPFVEKPASAEDHDVYIYYSKAMGGGSKRLHRKVEDKSSDFHPLENRVRRDGSYVYEEFMPNGGVDIKVYAVGSAFAVAQSRKSPAVDGVVVRTADGGEKRAAVELSAEQMGVVRQVVEASGQLVCGFDMIVSGGESWVIDVNGFSFVKKDPAYWDAAAAILDQAGVEHCRACAVRRWRERLHGCARAVGGGAAGWLLEAAGRLVCGLGCLFSIV